MATLGSLPIGAIVKDTNTTFYGKPILWIKVDKDHDGYPTNSTTLMAKELFHRGFDAKEASNSDSNRQNYGNNRYRYSNLRQWLHSDAAAGEWYTAQHSADAPPTDANMYSSYAGYSDQCGFLNGFSEAFKSALLETTIKVVLNTVTDGGSYETLTDKLFPPSRAEVFGSAENSIYEGSQLNYFSAGNSAIGYWNAESVAWYKTENPSTSHTAGGAGWWWLRSPASSGSYRVRDVCGGGSWDYAYAYGGYGGVRPLCNLSSDTLVSDTTDSDGCYTLSFSAATLDAPTLSVTNPIYCNPTYETGGVTGGTTTVAWSEVSGATSYVLERSVNNGSFAQIYSGASLTYTDTVLSTYESLQYRIKAVGASESEYTTSAVYVVQDNYPPFISGDESSLGEKVSRFSYDYTIYDGDDVSVTVKEYLNTTLLRTYTATGGVQNSLSLTSAQWGELEAGDNYIKIVVTDDNDASVTQTKHFTKLGGLLSLEYTPTGDISVHPKVINVELDLEKPFGASLQVLACNNGNDTQPAYDDITTAVKSGCNHIFTNTAKESGVSYWKVIIKIIINRNSTEGDIKLKGIRCQLDVTVS